MKKLLGIVIGCFILTGCSSAAESKIADCTYHWDAANVTLAKSYEWDINNLPGSGQDAYVDTMKEQVWKDWSALVLEAPSECFPEYVKKVAQQNSK